jgi:ABC-type enterochelin transport system substrate-binding protein
MHFQSPISIRHIAMQMAVLLSLLVISACAARQPFLSAEKIQTAYLTAIKDAAIAEPGEIYRNLTAITASNPDLIWQGVPSRSNPYQPFMNIADSVRPETKSVVFH